MTDASRMPSDAEFDAIARECAFLGWCFDGWAGGLPEEWQASTLYDLVAMQFSDGTTLPKM